MKRVISVWQLGACHCGSGVPAHGCPARVAEGPPVLLTPRPCCPHVPPPRELHPVGMRGTAVTRQGAGSLRQAPWPCVEDAAPRWHVGRVTQPSPTRFSPRGACRVASVSVRAEDRRLRREPAGPAAAAGPQPCPGPRQRDSEACHLRLQREPFIRGGREERNSTSFVTSAEKPPLFPALFILFYFWHVTTSAAVGKSRARRKLMLPSRPGAW